MAKAFSVFGMVVAIIFLLVFTLDLALGMPFGGASWFADADELVAAAGPELHRGVTVLIKGSRVNRLERVAAALAASGTTSQGGAH